MGYAYGAICKECGSKFDVNGKPHPDARSADRPT